MTAAAPSLMPEAFPAVTVPVLLNTGGSFAIFSRVVSMGRSSTLNTLGSPFLWGITTGTISSATAPLALAARALRWLS